MENLRPHAMDKGTIPQLYLRCCHTLDPTAHCLSHSGVLMPVYDEMDLEQ